MIIHLERLGFNDYSACFSNMGAFWQYHECVDDSRQSQQTSIMFLRILFRFVYIHLYYHQLGIAVSEIPLKEYARDWPLRGANPRLLDELTTHFTSFVIIINIHRRYKTTAYVA